MSNDKKLVLGTVIVLLVFAGIIVLPKTVSSFSGFGAAKTAAKPAKVAKPAPEPILPPLLKEADIIGSVWNVTVKGFTLKVSFSAEGKAVASSDNLLIRKMAKAKYGVESLPGKWRIEGPKLIVSTTFEGKDYTTELTISGTKLVSKEGVPIVRVS